MKDVILSQPLCFHCTQFELYLTENQQVVTVLYSGNVCLSSHSPDKLPDNHETCEL